MMKSKVFKIFILNSYLIFAQNIVEGTINFPDGLIAPDVEIYDNENGLITTSNDKGVFKFSTSKNKMNLIFISKNGNFIEKEIEIKKNSLLTIVLNNAVNNLTEVIIKANQLKAFQLKRLKDIEGTTINAGRKSEVILVDQSVSNLASNNSRQIFNQIAGLNIFENDDAGLQLNIGGRGLDPNRTSNFNTRQNGYDISADLLGYPESYYTPPAESLREIQIIRGAASLQYGTQFGGLLNFIIKSPVSEKEFEIISRNTIGSYNLYTNYTSLSGTKDKFSYLIFFNYKKGNGYRLNSNFKSNNTFINFNYKLNNQSILKLDLTYLNYLAQQGGGLSDKMFRENPYQSNRSRNWFGLDWFIYNLKFESDVTEKSKFSINFFGLKAQRNSIGFRSNRVDQIDPLTERDLISGKFNNYGLETRFLKKYLFLNKKSTLLIGAKLYNSRNKSEQGPGSNESDADFNFKYSNFPNYSNQSNYLYPNANTSLFAENIFYLSKTFSLTPGFRIEKIKTESDGYYKKINQDAAGNVILNQTIDNSEIRKRSFILFGVGISYNPSNFVELYANLSENYRSVTFSDISILNPSYSINPNITDENGNTIDLGMRGKFKTFISYDLSLFNLNYKNRIGFVQKATKYGNVKSERGNVGDAAIYGIESLIDFNLKRILSLENSFILNFFINSSFIDSQYVKSEIPGVKGKRVEFIPKNNFKTGIRFGYNNLMLSFQYTYLSNQFTDSSNAIEGNLSGVIGEIPAYKVSDISTSYNTKKMKFEIGVNNLFNETYFNRRATGYPGPGIIPSSPRTSYLTIQIKI